MRSKAAWVSAAIIAFAACAGSNDPSFDPSPESLSVVDAQQPLSARSELLTASDLLRARAQWTAEAVRRLRPDFFRATPILNGSAVVQAAPVVFVNGMFAGGLEVLESIPLDAVDEIRLLRPIRGYEIWGPACRCSGGAIQVKTRR